MLPRIILYGSLSFIVALVFWFAIAQPVQVLPRKGQVPAFTLKDQEHQWLSDSELRGRITFINIAYSRCGSDCAAQMETLSAFYREVESAADMGKPVHFATISIDQPYDTPSILAAYSKSLGVNAERWQFLSGEPAETKALVGGQFFIYYDQSAPTGAAGQISPIYIRDQRVVLVDDQGEMRAIYDGRTLDLNRLQRDLRMVQEEAASSGAMRSLYEAAHIFVCYPD